MDTRKIRSVLRISTILWVALFVALPAWAQNQPQPSRSGAAPYTGRSSSQSPTVNPHSREFRKFAKAYRNARTIEAHAIKRFHRILRKSPLSRRKLAEIQKSLNGPKGRQSAVVTPKERREYLNVTRRIDKVQRSAQTELANAVEKDGLTVAEFYQFIRVVERHPKLMRRLEQQ